MGEKPKVMVQVDLDALNKFIAFAVSGTYATPMSVQLAHIDELKAAVVFPTEESLEKEEAK